MLRRVVLVMTGIALATATALVMVPVGAGIGLALSPERGAALGRSLFDVVLALAASGEPQRDALAAARALWSLGLAVCCLPVVVVALIGEVARLRGLGWTVGATAAITALLPAGLSSAVAGPHGLGAGLDRFELILLVCSGAGAGFVYWLVAGEAPGNAGVSAENSSPVTNGPWQGR